MPLKVAECHLWSNEQLIHHEVVHRRRIAGYATGLTLSAATGIVTLGAAAPIVVPIGGFKVYKIHSHHKKLTAIREELARRNLSPQEKKKRDILIPMTITAAVYLVSMGIAGVADVIPDAIQTVVHEPIQEGLALSEEIMFEAGNKYQAFIVAEVAEAGLEKITEHPEHNNGKQCCSRWYYE